ncbi:MAG: protein kinase, partial [Verrucomicrobiales bacterium]|nr:protein kinase [Verrucomicrobiales bacterium]
MENSIQTLDSKIDLAVHQSFLQFNPHSGNPTGSTKDVTSFFEGATLDLRTEAMQGILRSVFEDLTGELDPDEDSPITPIQLTTYFGNPLPESLKELTQLLIAETPDVVDRFELVEKLGSGGMGSVYKAIDRERGTSLAIKFLHYPAPWMLLRFKQEFRLVNKLAHPNLVRFYEFFHQERLSFFTMEHIHGSNFLNWWHSIGGSETGNEPSDTALLSKLTRALLQLAEGLNALHQNGKLHRDIKPSNVMVTHDGKRVVLLDFGLVTNYVGRVGLFSPDNLDIVGTFPFMAPEIMEGLVHDVASDWYAFGVLLYQVLSGKLPFYGTYADITEQKISGVTPNLPNWVPPEIKSICQGLINPSPDLRPSFGEVWRALGGDTHSMPLSNSAFPHDLPITTIGREKEIGQLVAAYQESLKGVPALALVYGKSGLGKTCIIEELQSRIRNTPDFLTVLSGRCYEQESIPYKGIDDIMDQLSLRLLHLPMSKVKQILPADFPLLCIVFPVLAIVSEHFKLNLTNFNQTHLDLAAQKRRMLRAIEELFFNLGKLGPLVICLDDLQWCDKDCIAIIEVILNLADCPILVAGSFRSEAIEPAGTLTSLIEDRGRGPVFQVPIEELDEESLAQIAIQVLGEKAEQIENRTKIGEIVKESGGNAFFIIQLAKALKRGAKSLKLDSVLEDHVNELSEAEKSFLQLLAVAGHPIRRSLAVEAAGLIGNEQEFESDLRIGGLIKSSGPTQDDLLETYHDRIREGIVKSLEENELSSHHLKLARTLAQHTPEDHENLARHFKGGRKFDIAADHYLTAAKNSRRSLAFEHTVYLYRESLACKQRKGTDLANIRAAIGDALENAGKGHDAAVEFHQAAKIMAGTEDELKWKQREAHQYMISGHFDEGLRVIKEVLDRGHIKYPATHTHALMSAVLQSLYLRFSIISPHLEKNSRKLTPELADKIDTYWVTACGLGTIDVFRAADFHLKALRLSLRSGDPARIARSMALHAIYNGAEGTRSWNRTAQLLKLAGRYAIKAGDSYSKGVFEMARSGTFMLAGRFKESERAGRIAENRFRKHGEGVAWEIDTVQIY